MLNPKNKIKKLCFAALFAALTCLGTLISIPLPIGYFNLGDAMVLMGAFFLGPLWGAAAAGLGSALADIFLGFVIYAPATLVIKALVAIAAAMLYSLAKRILKSEKLDFVKIFVCSIFAEVIMVGGYFIYESLVLGYGLGALASVLGNCMQALVGAVVATICYFSLKKALKLN